MATGIATPYRDPRTAYGRRIPVGEATELAGIPPEMQPPRAAAPAAAPGAVQRVAGAVGPVAKTAGIGALPAVGALALRSGDDNGTSSTPPTPAGLGDIPRGIPGDIKTTAERAPFFAQSEAGRNIANAAMAIPGGSGIARAIGALPRIAAEVPTTAASVAKAAPLAADMVRGTVMADAAMGNIAAPAPASGLPPGVRPSTAGAGRGAVNPPTVGEMPAPQPGPNTIIRDGNSYSGPKGITEGAEIRRPNMALRNGGQLSVVGGGDEVAAIDARVRDINASMAQTQRGLDAYGPGPQGGGVGGIGGRTLSSANRQAFDSTPSLSNLPAAGQSVRQFQDLKAAEREGIRQRDTTERGQDAQLQAQLAATGAQRGIADLNARTQRDVATIGAQARTTAAETQANARAAAAEAGARRFTVVPGGQEVQEIGGMPTTIKKPDRVFNNATGTFVEQPGQQTGPTATPRAEYDKLPKGARYVGPDGKTYVKG